jgi:predicted NBD/HSP70 family sugar kinase
VETIASSVGIDRQARFLKTYYETRLQIPRNKRIAIDEVFSLCRQGDPLCVKLVENASEALANLIMDLVRVSDPDTVIVAGEMASDGFLLEHIREKLLPVTMRFVTGGVVLTQLDPRYIGLLGAASLALDNINKK